MVIEQQITIFTNCTYANYIIMYVHVNDFLMYGEIS